MEMATAEPTIATLQASTLLALYSLFEPRQGNYSQQIGFAVRLAIDLAGSESYEVPPALTSLQTILYCLENQAGSIFVRPTSLQEPLRPIRFAGVEPLELLCSLFRAQTRYQRGELDDDTRKAFIALVNDEVGDMHPNLAATIGETHLMLDPTTSAAIKLVETCSTPRFVATFVTPYCIQKAACLIVDGYHSGDELLKSEMLFAYSRAMSLLGALSMKWKSAGTIADALQLRMKGCAITSNGLP